MKSNKTVAGDTSGAETSGASGHRNLDAEAGTIYATVNRIEEAPEP
jgi:hypothetical protein